MKQLFDNVSQKCSRTLTHSYSTSFSLATRILGSSISKHIYNIYGFVRLADEIVDSFHDYDKEKLFDMFSYNLDQALENRISLNPILNSFQHTYHEFELDRALVDAFMKSMRQDLHKTDYLTEEEYKEYIYGSADVVGLMCLKIFVNGNQAKYDELKDSAMALGSAFQKVNFLRDLKADHDVLDRTYFPDTDLNELDEESKQQIIDDIEADFAKALVGIRALPLKSRLGVFVAYRYYRKLLWKLKRTPAEKIKESRIRISNYKKMEILTRSYVKYQLRMI